MRWTSRGRRHVPLPEELPLQRTRQFRDRTCFQEIECAVGMFNAKATGDGVEAHSVEILRHSMGHSQGEAGQEELEWSMMMDAPC